MLQEPDPMDTRSLNSEDEDGDLTLADALVRLFSSCSRVDRCYIYMVYFRRSVLFEIYNHYNKIQDLLLSINSKL